METSYIMDIKYLTRIFVWGCLLSFLPQTGFAQWTPVPGETQKHPVLLKGGILHLGNGSVIESGDILFVDGQIVAIGEVEPNQYGEELEEISVAGKHIYPGLILPNSIIGLSEISAFKATYDHTEHGKFNPNLTTSYAFTSDSEIIPTLRYNGILIVEAAPGGGVISGSSSVMALDGWNWKDSMLKRGAMYLSWPAMKRRQFDRGTGSIRLTDNSEYRKEVSEIRTLFIDAAGYGERIEKTSNLKLEAMQAVLNGEQSLFIEVDEPKGILESIEFFRELGIEKLVIISAEGALAVRDFLAKENIPVIVPPTLSLPSGTDEDYDLRYKLPFLLAEAGVKVALSHSGSITEARNLPFFAGVAVSQGMDKEEALKLVTSNPADILGVGDLVGTLEVGKHATLIVSEGDVLDITTNKIDMAFVQGRRLNLDNKQQHMYTKYKEKYGK
ncbi:amidohydrolase family protein [Algoriphagus sp. D3-2-R+10]|uniref:amidohydrolase family protein n=1 Tax=Algoriphagus aurantiacus TaxID=3103948 RepID=UPI002B3FA4D0|nr:amidohydrolase family protein [Algoriphagus sp. D3-2-R+10]MEB2777418.1 amidohydrolase family protein [Algoriphagus sp. D3-2-R+10]